MSDHRREDWPLKDAIRLEHDQTEPMAVYVGGGVSGGMAGSKAPRLPPLHPGGLNFFWFFRQCIQVLLEDVSEATHTLCDGGELLSTYEMR